MFVVCVDLFAQFVDELVEAEVDLSLDLVVQELLLEDGQRVVGAVVVQVQRVEDAPKIEADMRFYRTASPNIQAAPMEQ